ncbi:hypothetical protein CLU79DRAFT_422566 [Phycomyces nitens]|nr:hypothetical protein CLU79DRAFT_422566 [Phycomyces nitens]
MADLKNTMGQDRDSNVSMCSGCQQPLGFRNIVSHGKEGFHANCYACRVCRVAFRHPQECFEHEGGFYCERDYSNIHRQSICAGWYEEYDYKIKYTY